MSAYPLTVFWLKILGAVGAEVGIAALLFAAARGWCRRASWQRTLCQAALISSLLMAWSEFTGIGRAVSVRLLKSRAASMEIANLHGNLSRSELEPTRSAKQSALALADPKTTPKKGQRMENSNSSATDRRVSTGDAYVVRESASTNSKLWVGDSTVMLCLGIGWGIGMAFVGGRACLGRMVVIFIGRRRKEITDRELVERIYLRARGLGFSRPVRIVESRRLVSPIAFGFVRGTIGLPLNFREQFSLAKQEAMLTHELAHLAAYDPVWYFLADMAAAVLWWHPGVWWLRRQLHRSSELAADEASLMMPDGPRVLAECLVEMGAQLTRPAFGQLRVAGFRSDLGCRVRRLMGMRGDGWKPISRWRVLVARSFGPTVVAGTVILCTAWAVPEELTKGDSMKTMKKNWYRTLATFAAAVTFQAPGLSVAQENPGTTPTAGAPVSAPPAAIPVGQTPVEVRRELARSRAGAPGTPTPEGANPFYPGQPGNPPHGGRLEAKLREIVLDEVRFDSLPLGEVLNFLGEESHKRDPEKKGINFLLNPNPPEYQASIPGQIDPATGLPIAAGATESIDINSVSVRFNMPLRHVTMADVLNAIVRVADRPIQYAVEDYAVIFSLRPEAGVMPAVAGRASGPAPLAVRTFHVDTNTFVAGLESAFGIKIETRGKGESQSRKIQSALRELLAQLNVTMDGNKAIFYNELTGTVMVRLAPEDMEIMEAAIDTLGGQPMGNYAMGYTQPPVPYRK